MARYMTVVISDPGHSEHVATVTVVFVEDGKVSLTKTIQETTESPEIIDTILRYLTRRIEEPVEGGTSDTI